jgi:hypothetical protein
MSSFLNDFELKEPDILQPLSQPHPNWAQTKNLGFHIDKIIKVPKPLSHLLIEKQVVP